MVYDWYFLGFVKLNIDYINLNLYKLGCVFGMLNVVIFNVCYFLIIKFFLYFIVC